MRKVPPVKRRVGRPRKRPHDDPETQVQQTHNHEEIGPSSQSDMTPKPKKNSSSIQYGKEDRSRGVCTQAQHLSSLQAL